MRRIFLGAIAAAPVLFGGCDVLSPDLTENPVTFLVEESFFRNAADALAATKAVYGPLHSNSYYGQQFIVQQELQADYMDGRGSHAASGVFQHDSRNIQRIAGAWSAIYSSINRANVVIHRVPEIAMGQPLKDQYVAEARFIRALGYFNLVRLWGPVPLRTEPIVGLAELAAPRAPVADVYRAIIEDLQFAETNLPSSYDLANVGRATKWAAKTLLASVYLTREQYAEAAAKAKEVIDSGQFSLVEVQQADDFLKIFGPEVVVHSEEIFSVKFSGAAGVTNGMLAYIHNVNADYYPRGFRTVLGDTASEVLKTWHPHDLRREYNLYSASERDRKLLNKAEPELFKKYRDPTATNDTDIPVLRYPEVLLIFAEAEAMAQGAPTAAAYSALNHVRRRGFGYDPAAPSPVDYSGLSLPGFREAVLDERAWEFVLEGKRWLDLVRTDQALEVIRAIGEPISEKNLLWPIPTQELDNNEALSSADQNPGW